MNWAKKINFLLSCFYVGLIFVVIGLFFVQEFVRYEDLSYDQTSIVFDDYEIDSFNPNPDIEFPINYSRRSIVDVLIDLISNLSIPIGALFLAFIIHLKLQKVPSDLQKGNLITAFGAIIFLSLPIMSWYHCNLPDQFDPFSFLGECSLGSLILMVPAIPGAILWLFSIFLSSNLLWFKLSPGYFNFINGIFLVLSSLSILGTLFIFFL